MNHRYAVILLTLLMISPVFSISGEVILDDFEDGDISDWSILWGDGTSETQNITLSTFSHLGNYSILLNDSGDGPAVDFGKQDIGIELEHPLSYYNISFWYYATVPCSYPTDHIKHRFYISDESVFAFSSARLDSGDIMSCGQWKYVGLSIEDDFFEILGPFSVDSTSLGSFMIENWHNIVYYDDIKLIPKIPENTGGDCNPDWACTEWRDCENDLQNRICIDSNDCGDDSTMPSLQRSCGIIIELIEPSTTIFFPNQAITIKVNVSYSNGTVLSGLNLEAFAFGIEIPLNEAEEGIYSVMLITNEDDVGVWDISFSGIQNYQFPGLEIEVREMSAANSTSFLSDLYSMLSGFISFGASIIYSFWYAILILAVLLVSGLVIRKTGMPKIRRQRVKKPKRKKEDKETKKREPDKTKEDKIDHDGLHEVKL